ncbi:MAG TPA: tetratricopeptide repeat protein [Geobacteraceae bacterium]
MTTYPVAARVKLWICLLLAVTTLLVFWQTGRNEFINYDDNLYVTANPHVYAGLARESVLWAFSSLENYNWHPLTWLSHMTDCQLYRLAPRGHHLTNVLFHAANAVLLFLVLARMTGMLWRSAFVAALFALHPLHVESVAWVAERKDVLSGLFWMLVILAYARYVERPGRFRYVVALLAFALGLMAKPMLVTLPFVLLLLDYWPLGRCCGAESGMDADGEHAALPPMPGKCSIRGLLLEKIPFLALSVAASMVTVLAQSKGGSVLSLGKLSFPSRVANAVVSYLKYIGKMVWPAKLAVIYPIAPIPFREAAGATVLLVLLTVLVVLKRRRYPFLPVGWFWFLGTLVPVIGLVQVGSQAMADRYTYLPLVGLFIIIAWGAPAMAVHWRHRRAALAAASLLSLAVLSVCTWRQVGHWRNSEELFTHALAVTANNPVAHNHLATALVKKGRNEEAIAHSREALRLAPNYASAHHNLGMAFAAQGRLGEAVEQYLAELRIIPQDVDAHDSLGIVLAREGLMEEAMAQFAAALRINPNDATAHNNVGVALAQQGRIAEARDHFLRALRINPYSADALQNLRLSEQLGKSPRR